MAYRSEIRDSTKNELIEKVANNNYEQYLKKIRFHALRMLNGQAINFDFPVTALIGSNGGGKTTVLGASGCIYKDIKPNQFFAKSGKLDEAMQNWKIEYTLIDKNIKTDDTIRRTASYKSYRWKRGALERDCVFFGVSRTVPANERIELKKCASPSFAFNENDIFSLENNVKNNVEKILGKDISNFASLQIDQRGKISLLSGNHNGSRYSEFHFGAGESSIIRMLMLLENIEDNSLVLIEEIENGLHPVATIRVVEYLIDLSKRKKTQVVFTTHSNDALVPLPDCAIWACIDGTLVQGKLNIHAIRTITGEVDTGLAIFVEDDFAKAWIRGILKKKNSELLESIEIHPMYGDGSAVKINTFHNSDPTSKYPSICIIDGDSQESDSAEDKVFRLPGESPETYIYDKVMDKISECKGQLSVILLRDFKEQDMVKQVVEETRRTNRDPHLLYSQIGEKVGFLAEDSVRDAFIYIWTQYYPDEVDTIVGPFAKLLPQGS